MKKFLYNVFIVLFTLVEWVILSIAISFGRSTQGVNILIGLIAFAILAFAWKYVIYAVNKVLCSNSKEKSLVDWKYIIYIVIGSITLCSIIYYFAFRKTEKDILVEYIASMKYDELKGDEKIEFIDTIMLSPNYIYSLNSEVERIVNCDLDSLKRLENKIKKIRLNNYEDIPSDNFRTYHIAKVMVERYYSFRNNIDVDYYYFSSDRDHIDYDNRLHYKYLIEIGNQLELNGFEVQRKKINDDMERINNDMERINNDLKKINKRSEEIRKMKFND